MSTERKTIINMSLQGLVLEFQEHVQQGWEMDMQHPIGLFGHAHEMGLIRSDKSLTALAKAAEAAVEGKPVRTRAEILAAARDAKRAKRAEAVQ